MIVHSKPNKERAKKTQRKELQFLGLLAWKPAYTRAFDKSRHTFNAGFCHRKNLEKS